MLDQLPAHVIITAYLSSVFRKRSFWIILAELSNSFSPVWLLNSIKHGWRAMTCTALAPPFPRPFAFLTYKISYCEPVPIVPVTDARKYFSKTFCFGVKGQPLRWLGSKTDRQATRLPATRDFKVFLWELTFLLLRLHPTLLLATCALGVGQGTVVVLSWKRSAGDTTLAALCSPAL